MKIKRNNGKQEEDLGMVFSSRFSIRYNPGLDWSYLNEELSKFTSIILVLLSHWLKREKCTGHVRLKNKTRSASLSERTDRVIQGETYK